VRLQRSLNPVKAPAPAEGLVQLHYAGANDTQVPPELLRAALAPIGREPLLLPQVRHNRGWDRHWPAILADLDSRLEQRSHGREKMGNRATEGATARLRMPD
jgi:hypothetical protein